MNRMWLTVVGAVLLAATRAPGQGVGYGAGGGVLVPISDYHDIDKAGWVVGADLTYWLASASIGIRLEGSYSQTSQRAGACCIDHQTKIAGGMVDIVYEFGTTEAPMRPYVLGGLGVYNLRFTATGFPASSDTRLGFGAGAGLAWRMGGGRTRLFVEGKITTFTVNHVQFASVPIRAGLRFEPR